MNDDYQALAGRIRLEVTELDRVSERISLIWGAATESEEDFLVDAAALNLHGFYAGLEHLFTAIAAEVDHSLPAGESWHVELLRQMAAEVPGVRPPVISADMIEQLDRYRGFRHVVRNVYSYRLDARQVAVLVEDVGAVHSALRAQLLSFAERLSQIGE